jgi:hypothetical protein
MLIESGHLLGNRLEHQPSCRFMLCAKGFCLSPLDHTHIAKLLAEKEDNEIISHLFWCQLKDLFYDGDDVRFVFEEGAGVGNGSGWLDADYKFAVFTREEMDDWNASNGLQLVLTSPRIFSVKWREKSQIESLSTALGAVAMGTVICTAVTASAVGYGVSELLFGQKKKPQKPAKSESRSRLEAQTARDEGYKPFHIGAREGDLQSVKLCLESGIFVDVAAGEKGFTALHLASHENRISVIYLLLAYGANPNAVNAVGDSALHSAASRGNLGVVKVLVQKGAHPKLLNSLGKSPAQLADLAGHTSVYEFLSNHS